MNLEDTIEWMERRIENEKASGAPKGQIKSDEKIVLWLKELLRYRLFYSEYHREIHLSKKNRFTKQEILDLLDGECEDWRLFERID